ncbi:MAG: hypothetical protein HQK57_14100 [Deltaproteobacteria bacterium]|nr:hypothetical protein [Deltaproteobacteria bacterium]MBF0526690.1 hypothetical protein [Deltaproteobacteria bacterium]
MINTATKLNQTESIKGPIFEGMIDYSDCAPGHLENASGKSILQQFQEKYTKELLSIISRQNFEYGFYSRADEFVRKRMEQNAARTKEWLLSVFVDYFSDLKIMIGLLQVILHMDYFDIYPQGQDIALAALAHSDAEVRECGIRAFENWGTPESLRILKTINYREKWLQEYIDQVILDLEEELS